MPTITCNGKQVELIRPLIQEPANCPFCGEPTSRNQTQKGEGAITMCVNPNCPVKQDGKLKTWFKKVEILGVGDSVRHALQEQLGIYTAADIYRLGTDIAVEDIREIIVSGESKLGSNADSIVEEINKKRDLPLHIFLGALGIDGLGRREVEIACEKAPDELSTLADWRSDKLRDPGLQARINAPSKAERWADGIAAVSDVIDGLLHNGVVCRDYIVPTNTQPSGGILAGKVMVFTGAIQRVGEDGKRFTRDMMHAKAIANGAEIAKKIGNSKPGCQFVLVQADANSQSSKSIAAKNKGAEIISEAAFWEAIGE